MNQSVVHSLIGLGRGFLLLVFLVLLLQNLKHSNDDPLQAQTLIPLKEELRRSPQQEDLKSQIREADLQIRQSYFSHLNKNRRGAWLLLLGGAFTLWLYSLTKRLVPELPDADKIRMELNRRQDQVVPFYQWLPIFAMFTLTFLVGLGVVPAGSLRTIPKMNVGPPPTGSEAHSHPSQGEINLQWPQFMGPLGNGFSDTANPPNPIQTGFSSKTQVPVPGNSSPVVWGERIYLTGGSSESRSVTAIDLVSGKVLWTTPFPQPESQSFDLPDIPEETGYAACTPATDGRAVYAVFTTGEIMGVDAQGAVLWSRFLGPLDNPYGHAASLVCHEGLLFVQLDQAHEPGKSKMLALSTLDGRTVWQQPRPVISSWSTPVKVGEGDESFLFTISDPLAIAYRIGSGEEVWRSDMLSGEITPSPVSVNGMVFVITPWDKLAAFHFSTDKPEGEPGYAWVFEDNVPDIATPATDGERIYALTTPGTLTCIEIASGRVLWAAELDAEFHASPVLSKEKVFLISTDGEVIVLDNGNDLVESQRLPLGERVVATPALKGDRLIIRGDRHLFIFHNSKPLASVSP